MALVAEIAITGGPCSGKTTGMARLVERLSELGYRVLVVPELATIYIAGGISDIGRLAVEDRAAYLTLQRVILKQSMQQRRHYRTLAEEAFPNERVVVLYDRGAMDSAAYMEPGEFQALLEELRLTLADVRDPYTAVIHLVTAADGAAEFYTTANNAARYESPEGAIAVDRRTQQAWVGHPHLRVIGNDAGSDFEGKLNRVFGAVARVLGIPEPLEIENKFLLAAAPDFTHPALAGAQRIDIEQAYLLPVDGRQIRVRRRSQHGGARYYYTTKAEVRPGVRIETERSIKPVEYQQQLAQRDPERRIIAKHRYCFLYKGQYFELDHILEPASRECWLLEIELTAENDSYELPDFLAIERDVTNDKRYNNGTIALG
jgi:CYTH domain-containing protein/thymidylate kinase